jgi:pSer/pThr/pTyr-binding forkhead associated (FHA) protein
LTSALRRATIPPVSGVPAPGCLFCTQPAAIGLLCVAHAAGVARCADLTAEQIVDADVPEPLAGAGASVVDQWGGAHLVAHGVRLGRTMTTCDLAILHPSVSGLHAVVGLGNEGWSIEDKNSLNGTFVNDRRVSSGPLRHGDRLQLGEVGLYFVTRSLPHTEPTYGPGRTVPARRGDIAFTAVLVLPDGSMVEMAQRPDGGVVRMVASTAELGRMEFALLKLLVERRRGTTDPELAFTPWHEIAEALRFRSIEADSENVRELVRRVRRKLGGGADLVESRQGVGYRLNAVPVR